jgi:predicted nucleotidyltransferase
MLASPSVSDELERAAACLARDPRVLAVYGFGSQARGEAGPRSDVDVAVLLDRNLSLGDELRLRAQVTRELQRDDIDLVVLEQAPPLLRYEITAAARRLYARDGEAADRFEERAAQECFDTAHLRAVQQRYAREARQG